MNQLPSVQVPEFRAAVGDPGTRGFKVNLSEIAAAQAIPQLDTRSFSVEAGAMGAIGQGMQGLAQGLDSIAMAQFASINRRKVDEASAKLEAASDDIAAKIQDEQDETKWPSIFEGEASKWEGELLKDKTLSPAAQDAIRSKHSAWKITGLSGVKRASFNTSIKKEAETLEGGRIQALSSGNFSEAERLTAEQEQRGLIGADVAARQRVQTQQAQEQKREDEQAAILYDEASADPRAFLEKYKDRPEDMPPALHSRMVNFAQQADREQVAADVDSLENAVVTGQLTVPAEVDEWQKDNPRITPAMREAVRSHLIRRNDATAKANIEANAPEIASQLYSEVRAFDWKKDGEEKYWKLRLRINELPAPIAGEVSGPLEAKFPGRASKIKPASESVELVEKTLDSMLERGAFGKNASGKADLSELFPQVTKGAYTAEFPMEKERALKLKAETGGKIRRWLDANPDATPEQAQKKLYEMVPDGTRAGMFDLFDSPAKIEPAKPGMDATPGDPKNNEALPSDPGPADNILLPFPQ